MMLDNRGLIARAIQAMPVRKRPWWKRVLWWL